MHEFSARVHKECNIVWKGVFSPTVAVYQSLLRLLLVYFLQNK